MTLRRLPPDPPLLCWCTVYSGITGLLEAQPQLEDYVDWLAGVMADDTGCEVWRSIVSQVGVVARTADTYGLLFFDPLSFTYVFCIHGTHLMSVVCGLHQRLELM